MLVKSRVLRGNYDGHDILRRDCAQEIKRCKKPHFPERVRTNTQAVLLLAWGGLAKGNQWVLVFWQKQISRCNKSRLGLPAQGLGPGPPGAWGPDRPCGRWLKRLPQRWGPGGKRARDTPPTFSPTPPLPAFPGL